MICNCILICFEPLSVLVEPTIKNEMSTVSESLKCLSIAAVLSPTTGDLTSAPPDSELFFGRSGLPNAVVFDVSIVLSFS